MLIIKVHYDIFFNYNKSAWQILLLEPEALPDVLGPCTNPSAADEVKEVSERKRTGVRVQRRCDALSGSLCLIAHSSLDAEGGLDKANLAAALGSLGVGLTSSQAYVPVPVPVPVPNLQTQVEWAGEEDRQLTIQP
ncbi:hypothetical protein K439DRAFT_1618505 [Ramaria rubella]|nr:hypothetical protein K439DRAFT_1618505 [Ramaria rubella]